MIVYVDMDGVVADFDGHVASTYGKRFDELSAEEQDRFWEVECVQRQFFAHAPVISLGVDLVRALADGGAHISFLTSTGGGQHHCDIARQKLDFLQAHGIGRFPVAFATGTQCKAMFAHNRAVLIDDRQKVVDAFLARGGRAFLFTGDNGNEIVASVLDTIRTDIVRSSELKHESLWSRW